MENLFCFPIPLLPCFPVTLSVDTVRAIPIVIDDSPSPAAEHCPIIPLTRRTGVPRPDCHRTALHFLARSAEDPRQTVHPHGHGFCGHVGAADDHSAPAVLREGTRRLGRRRTRVVLWHW